MPLVGRNCSFSSPFHKVLSENVVRHFMITYISWISKCISLSVSQMKDHLSLSYAFSRSILIVIQPFFLFFDFMECIISCIMTISSPVRLPSTKLDCSGEIKSDKIVFNLLTMQLVISLYKTLHSPIGLNHVTLCEFAVFGVEI